MRFHCKACDRLVLAEPQPAGRPAPLPRGWRICRVWGLELLACEACAGPAGVGLSPRGRSLMHVRGLKSEDP